MERRLAAIVIADVVGYSRLVRENEEGTRARFQALQNELFVPSATAHGGRVIKTMGDALLLEFPSAVEAVACAVEVQREMTKRESAIAADRRIRFRVGINLGDIIVEDDDIHGDGVNVAARLEELAEPGGILISSSVHEQVRHRVTEVGFEDVGDQEVKNLTDPVRAYRVLLDSSEARAKTFKATSGPSRLIQGTVAAVVLLAVIAGGLWYWQPWTEWSESVQSEKTATEQQDKPAIAVLPFASMSSDKEQEYFADGISEDLTTQLSKISGLLVISRTSTFKYKGKNLDVREIARELGVRYVLEGSVRRGGDQLRINAQLIDATSGGHLWAETYDGAVGDVFALQDRINRKIVTALKVQLTGDEQVRIVDRGTTNVEAYEAFLRGERLRKYAKKNVYDEAIQEYEKAIALDPKFAAAHAGLGHVLFTSATFSEGLKNRQESWSRAQALADKSVQLGEAPLGYLLKARISLFLKLQHEQAMLEAKRVVELAPNYAEGHAMLGEVILYSGQLNGALKALAQAMLLDPGFPERYKLVMGQVKFHQGKYEAALEDMAAFCSDAVFWLYQRTCKIYQTAAYAQAGDIAKAKSLPRVMSTESMANFSTLVALTFPFKDPKYAEQLLAGLRKVLPD